MLNPIVVTNSQILSDNMKSIPDIKIKNVVLSLHITMKNIFRIETTIGIRGDKKDGCFLDRLIPISSYQYDGHQK